MLLILLSLVALSSALCTPKETTAISKCYETLMAGYNITMHPKQLPEYWVYHNTRMDWLNRQGLNAQPTICTLSNNLEACLKPHTCFGAAEFEFLGVANTTEASDYWIDYAVSNYQCGAGYNILMTDFYCIGTCRDQHQADLDKCTAKAKDDVVLKGPCRAEQSLLTCQSDIFTKCCDYNAGVFFCNNVLAGINAEDPKCYNEGKVSCPNPRTMAEILKNPALRLMMGTHL